MHYPLSRSELKRLTVLAFAAGIATMVTFLFDRFPQDPAYHRFADQQTWFGIPHFWNVISNVPFLFVGLAGLHYVWGGSAGKDRSSAQEKGAWTALFSGVFLTGFGSAWYHLAPDNDTLVWDRLPMAVGFMGLFAGIIAERISHQAYRLLLWPLIGIGVASVISWYASELQGAGDLRLYGLVQFFPLLTIPVMMAVYSPKYSHSIYVVFAITMYGVAKAAEHYDADIHAMTGGIMSGHALKHIFAAVGCYFLVVMVKIRSQLTVDAAS
jgi:hypothetical protein